MIRKEECLEKGSVVNVMNTKEILEHIIRLHQELEYVRKQKRQAIYQAKQIIDYHKDKNFHADTAAKEIINSLSKDY